ncbi:nose resistant to fluoxetine protein 6-like [Zerene cesonia]|uniref:nose resistant to fluoxetine protein 6-like n=1 Tax=Zerene cesonia TaxID=33412 RepID=UPI0018E5553B|nr:nose resistant to fluoxetine protein 6-like [Zerene cesonia]
MLKITVVLLFACAIAAENNDTDIDKQVLKRLATVIGDNKNLDPRDVTRLYRTAQVLGIDKDLVDKIFERVNESDRVIHKDKGYNVYSDAEKGPLGESPDYASSVVLASDLLSLTSAVSNVADKLCREQGYRFLDGLLSNKRWALKMFDASAKSPQGLLFGSSYHLGNFDECMDIDEPGDGLTVEGQYCLATIKWREGEESKKIRTGRGESLRWAVCVPSSCDARSVARFVGDILSHSVGNTTKVEVTEKDCYTRRPLTVNKLDISFLVLMLFFALILTLSTSYEIYAIRNNKKETNLHNLIVSFSIINNIKKILSTKQNNGLGLECIAGIKALAMVFIIAGHACLFIGSGPVMDAKAWDRLIQNPVNAFMLNNTLLVDTFLFLSAFLFSRLMLIELDKRRGRLNVIPILVFRYIRVTPAYFVVIFFYMTWLPKIGEGPLWENRIQLEQERCIDSWWTNILYINNYVNTDRMCMFQSWYLSVDTQLFFVAPFFIYSLWHWRRFGPVLIAIATIVSLVIPSIITYRDHLDPTFLFYAKEFTDFVTNFYFIDAYIKTHMKMTPYFMGLLTGYILHRIQVQNYEFSNLLKIFGWTTSIILGTVTTFSVSLFYQDWYQYSTIEAAAYISLHKFAWSIANGWLIIACATGNGGLLGKFLSWRFLVPIAKLTFCAYLVNGIIELYYVGQLRHPLHITFFTISANAISHLVLTFFLALILCITFESPLHGIEKILLRMFARPVLSDNANVRKSDSGEFSRNTSQSRLDS